MLKTVNISIIVNIERRIGFSNREAVFVRNNFIIHGKCENCFHSLNSFTFWNYACKILRCCLPNEFPIVFFLCSRILFLFRRRAVAAVLKVPN